MDGDIPELELSLRHCLDVGSPSVVISINTVHKFFPNTPHPDYPETPCLDWDNLNRWANSKGWDVKIATEDTENGKQIIPGIRFSPLKESSGVPNTTTNPDANIEADSSKKPNKPNLLNSPIGYLWITAIATVLAAIMLYLIKTHLGIPLPDYPQ